MTRDKALALFDALALRGYTATLHVFHGQSVNDRNAPIINEPLYNVQFGPHDRGPGFTLDDLHAIAAIAAEHDAKLSLFGNEGSWAGSLIA
jgi:hypothetical protein